MPKFIVLYRITTSPEYRVWVQYSFNMETALKDFKEGLHEEGLDLYFDEVIQITRYA